jgi:hypothetical protein
MCLINRSKTSLVADIPFDLVHSWVTILYMTKYCKSKNKVSIGDTKEAQDMKRKSRFDDRECQTGTPEGSDVAHDLNKGNQIS